MWEEKLSGLRIKRAQVPAQCPSIIPLGGLWQVASSCWYQFSQLQIKGGFWLWVSIYSCLERDDKDSSSHRVSRDESWPCGTVPLSPSVPQNSGHSAVFTAVLIFLVLPGTHLPQGLGSNSSSAGNAFRHHSLPCFFQLSSYSFFPIKDCHFLV